MEISGPDRLSAFVLLVSSDVELYRSRLLSSCEFLAPNGGRCAQVGVRRWELREYADRRVEQQSRIEELATLDRIWKDDLLAETGMSLVV